MIGIYKITSPSGKIYIGQSINIENRISVYRRLKCKSQPRIYSSLLKYGFENHKFEIICECLESELNDLERFYQDIYSSDGKKGLNCQLTKTDKQKFKHSNETRVKMSESAKNRPKKIKEKIIRPKYIATTLHRENMSKNSSKYWLGKVRSKSTNDKIKIKLTGLKHSQEAKDKKSKIVLDINSGVYYRSAREVSNLYKIPYSTVINKLCGHHKNNTPFIYL